MLNVIQRTLQMRAIRFAVRREMTPAIGGLMKLMEQSLCSHICVRELFSCVNFGLRYGDRGITQVTVIHYDRLIFHAVNFGSGDQNRVVICHSIIDRLIFHAVNFGSGDQNRVVICHSIIDRERRRWICICRLDMRWLTLNIMAWQWGTIARGTCKRMIPNTLNSLSVANSCHNVPSILVVFTRSDKQIEVQQRQKVCLQHVHFLRAHTSDSAVKAIAIIYIVKKLCGQHNRGYQESVNVKDRHGKVFVTLHNSVDVN
mmetsp:Transcript_1019/g.1157  ORF Transcript_1019/g.1157 Transcript_1019/m.1157 type:complete len:258 (-) Transcript_1019:213-986(-)